MVRAMCGVKLMEKKRTEELMDMFRFTYRYSFICQGTSIRRQRSDLFGLRVKLQSVITNLTTQR